MKKCKRLKKKQKLKEHLNQDPEAETKEIKDNMMTEIGTETIEENKERIRTKKIKKKKEEID